MLSDDFSSCTLLLQPAEAEKDPLTVAPPADPDTFTRLLRDFVYYFDPKMVVEED